MILEDPEAPKTTKITFSNSLTYRKKWEEVHAMMRKSQFIVDVLVEAKEIKEQEKPMWLLWTDFGTDFQ